MNRFVSMSQASDIFKFVQSLKESLSGRHICEVDPRPWTLGEIQDLRQKTLLVSETTLDPRALKFGWDTRTETLGYTQDPGT